MKAMQFARYGAPDVLELVEAAEPHAGEGQVRIQVRAAGVNAMAWKLRTGQLQEMSRCPCLPGQVWTPPA